VATERFVARVHSLDGAEIHVDGNARLIDYQFATFASARAAFAGCAAMSSLEAAS
jgi:hypothetical protein